MERRVKNIAQQAASLQTTLNSTTDLSHNTHIISTRGENVHSFDESGVHLPMSTLPPSTLAIQRCKMPRRVAARGGGGSNTTECERAFQYVVMISHTLMCTDLLFLAAP